MPLLFELVPMLAFFIGYRWGGVYPATVSVMVASALQLLIYWIQGKPIPLFQWASLIFLGVLGSATLIFQNSEFIKWKPTMVYWACGIACSLSHYFKQTNLIKRFLGSMLSLPDTVWVKLNHYWIAFFISLGFLNIGLVYTVDTNTWVNCKLFAFPGITVLFVMIQVLCLSRFIKPHYE